MHSFKTNHISKHKLSLSPFLNRTFSFIKNRSNLHGQGTSEKEQILDKKFLKSLPKIELHCHVDGSLPLETIKKFSQRCGISLPKDPQLLKERTSVTSKCKTLFECFQLFNLQIDLLQTKTNIEEGVLSILEKASEENVKYIELRFAPQLHLKEGLTISKVLESAVKGFKRGKSELGIEGGIIVGALGDLSEQLAIDLFQSSAPFLNQAEEGGVVGVDLCRVINQYHNFGTAFKIARQLGYPITIHTGEIGSPEFIATSLEQLYANRIGHGVHCIKYEQIIETLVKKQIPLEVCMTSNVQSNIYFPGGFHSYQSHPVRKLLDHNIKVTINTDNRTISDTTLTREFHLLNKYHHFGIVQFEKVFSNALDSIFAPPPVKQKLQPFLKEYQSLTTN
ncbi:adenosine deaminase [Anaeramoeba flamelloides]|uniref:adenosine deaminase n=1 Tax=Anaeramoeba flamelloides TaxID=1746091 RepID=A0AAV7ZPF3_9EUKA|nr:adenosine deaminase [Anaeramoeba flamelloides]